MKSTRMLAAVVALVALPVLAAPRDAALRNERLIEGRHARQKPLLEKMRDERRAKLRARGGRRLKGREWRRVFQLQFCGAPSCDVRHFERGRGRR